MLIGGRSGFGKAIYSKSSVSNFSPSGLHPHPTSTCTPISPGAFSLSLGDLKLELAHVFAVTPHTMSSNGIALRVNTRETPIHSLKISIEPSTAPHILNPASKEKKKNGNSKREETYLTSTCSPCVRSCSTSDARGIAYIMPNEQA